jgi:GNAT superfamily N-acetyltransferase
VNASQPTVVRRLEPGEQKYIAPVTLLVNRAYLPAIVEIFTIAFDRASQDDFAGFIGRGEIVIAEHQNRVVGVVHAKVLDDDSSWFGLLAVDPDRAGSGVARELLDHIEAEALANGQRWMELDLILPEIETPHQARPHRWYARRGYLELNRKPWSPPDPQLVAALKSPCWSVRQRKALR